MPAKKNAVSVDLSMLTSLVDQIKAIDEQLVKAKGTASEWNTKGRAAAEATELGQYIGAEPFVCSFTIEPTTTVKDHLSEVRAYVEAAEQFGNELMTAWIKANRSDSDSTSGLKTKREELVTQAEAFRVVFGQMGVKDLPEVPKAPRTTATTGGSKRSGSKTIQFYRLIAGEKVTPSDDQNSLSSMAFYSFGRCGVDALKKALASKGWDGTMTTSQVFEGVKVHSDKTNQDHEWTIGWDIVSPADATPADDATPDEEEEAAEAALVEGVDQMVEDLKA